MQPRGILADFAEARQGRPAALTLEEHSPVRTASPVPSHGLPTLADTASAAPHRRTPLAGALLAADMPAASGADLADIAVASAGMPAASADIAVASADTAVASADTAVASADTAVASAAEADTVKLRQADSGLRYPFLPSYFCLRAAQAGSEKLPPRFAHLFFTSSALKRA